jgi:O-antigen/teichoic acid export membrane protein
MRNQLNKIFNGSLKTIAVGSIVVFIGTMTGNVGAYLYHLFMGRILGPSGYGEFSSLISLLYLFSVPTSVLSLVLTKFFSEIKAKDRKGVALDLFIRTSILIFWCLLIGFIVFLIFSYPLTTFLHLKSVVPVFFVYGVFVFSTLSFVCVSYLQGNQFFFWFSGLTAFSVLSKLFISIPMARFGLFGVMAAMLIAAVVSYLIYLIPLRNLFKIPRIKSGISAGFALKQAIPILLIMLGVTSIFSTDVVLVKHFLIPLEAGIYSAVSILGKVIFYAGSSITAVVYPVIAERTAKKLSSDKIIRIALISVICISVMVTIIYAIFPQLVTNLLFGHSFSTAAKYLAPFSIFLSFYSLNYLILMIALAENKPNVWISPVIAAILQVLGIMIYHKNIGQIINVNIIITIGMTILTWTLFNKHEKT